MENIYTTFVKKTFDVAERQRESDVDQHVKRDDIGQGLEVAKGVVAHFPRLTVLYGRLNAGAADITTQNVA